MDFYYLGGCFLAQEENRSQGLAPNAMFSIYRENVTLCQGKQDMWPC